MSESDEFDHYLSDNDLDLESFDQLEQSINSNSVATSKPNPAPPRAPPGPHGGQAPCVTAVPPSTRPSAAGRVQPLHKGVSSNSRPSTSFLRPPKPPPRQDRPPTQVATTGSPARARQTTEEPAPPAKRRRVSLNEQGEEGFVDPNPFNVKSAKIDTIREEEGEGRSRGSEAAASTRQIATGGDEYVEEDMPEIRLKEGKNGEVLGYELEPKRGTTVVPKDTKSTVVAGPLDSVGAKVGPVRLVRRANNLGSSSAAALGGKELHIEESAVSSRATDDPGRQPGPGSKNGTARSDSSTRPFGTSEVEQRELEELRRERAELQAALAAQKKEHQKVKEQLYAKSGESQLVRNRMVKAEEVHQAALREEQALREKAEAAVKAKEQELFNEREKAKTKAAFAQIEQQQNVLSSARKSAHRPQQAGLSQRSANRGSRGESVPISAGRGREGESPSIGRSRGERASSMRPSPQDAGAQVPTFANFHNSFAESPRANSSARRSPRRNQPAQHKDLNRLGQTEEAREQEGLMAPPPFPMTAGKNRKGALKSTIAEDRKGKGKETRVTDEDESFFSEGHGGEFSFSAINNGVGRNDGSGKDEPVVEEEEAEEDGPDWDWVEEERDWRGEILGALFSHTTFDSLDTSSSLPTPVPTTHLRSTAFFGATAPHSRSHAFSASTLTARLTHQPTSTRSSTSMSRQNSHNSSTSFLAAVQPEPSPSPGPVSTFHALTNLRFPPNSSPEHVASYESATRNIFTLLGRRLDPRLLVLPQPSLQYPTQAEFDAPSSTSQLCSNLSHSFLVLLSVLNDAGLVGAMTALLSLINHLVYLFPVFATSILENSTTADDEASTASRGGMLALVAKMISRYGKPSNPSTLQASNAPEKLQGRRFRQATRISASRAKRKANRVEEDRVIIEDDKKRDSLVKELTAVVEGLAWSYTTEENKISRAAEEQFIGFLRTANTISTLIDPAQPVDTLLSTIRTLALLAARTVFYREILAIPISEGSDIRKTKPRIPVFDRIATLLNLNSESPRLDDLHSALLVLSSTLLTHQPDALRLIAESPRFFAEGLIKRIYRDVETVWEWDGRTVGRRGAIRTMLRRTTLRLSSCVTLLYYLLKAPHSSLSLQTILANSEMSRTSSTSSTPRMSHARDWCTTSLSTLAFTETLPSWTELEDEEVFRDGDGGGDSVSRDPGEGEEGARLMEMKYLAQEILEEITPDELESIGDCFGLFEDEEDVEEKRTDIEEIQLD